MAATARARSGQARTRRRRRALGSLLGLAALALLVWAWWPRPLEVDLATVDVGPLRVTVDEDGQTRLRERFVVAAPLAGRLERIRWEPGDFVKEGEVLAVITPAAPPLLDVRTRAEAEARLTSARAARARAQAAVAQGEVDVQQAQREAERQAELLRQRATTQQAAEQAQFTLRAQQAELRSRRFGLDVATGEVQSAQAALQRLGTTNAGEQVQVPSPVAGRVLRLAQQSEAVVPAGAPLLELGDAQDLEITVDVLTTDAVQIRRGMPVVIDRWGGEQALFGEVSRVEPAAFTKTSALGVEEQRVNVRVRFIDPPEKYAALADGWRVETRIVVWSDAGALKAPASAIFRRGDGYATFLFDAGRARLREVVPGRSDGRETQVIAGLARGAQVVVYPSERLADGMRVTAR